MAVLESDDGPVGPSGPPAPADESGGRGHLARNAAIITGILVVALIALLATGKTNEEREASAKILGQAVPEVRGTTLNGEAYDIDVHRGNWVVVNFFASWCTPCRVEQPELVKFSEEHAAAGDVEVVSVAFQDKDADVRDFFSSAGGDWPVLVGDTGSVALSFGVTAVPESYVIAPDGQVVAKFEGVTADALDSVIATYSGAAAPAAPSPDPSVGGSPSGSSSTTGSAP